MLLSKIFGSFLSEVLVEMARQTRDMLAACVKIEPSGDGASREGELSR